MPDAPLLLLTRPTAAARHTCAALKARGVAFQPIFAPAMRIVFEQPKLPQVRGLVLTSANGAEAWRRVSGPALPVYAVGSATARAAKGIGPVWSADGDAEALVAGLRAIRPDTPLLHLHGQHSRGDVAARLTSAGLTCHAAIGYRQEACAPDAAALAQLQGGRPVVAPLYSPRTATIISEWPIKAPLLVAAMSEAVSNACAVPHIEHLKVATRPDSEDMLSLVAELLGEASALEGRP